MVYDASRVSLSPLREFRNCLILFPQPPTTFVTLLLPSFFLSFHFTSILDTSLTLRSQSVVVVTTVGPFDRYGTPLVELCAQWGTHYCDITGETNWVREMIEKYDALARETGSKIVHFCGHDCLPWVCAIFHFILPPTLCIPLIRLSNFFFMARLLLRISWL